jgi:hypothetical protein
LQVLLESNYGYFPKGTGSQYTNRRFSMNIAISINQTNFIFLNIFLKKGYFSTNLGGSDGEGESTHALVLTVKMWKLAIIYF